MEYITLSPNRKLFYINSPQPSTTGCLQINNADWLAASRTLNGIAFKVYFYLVSRASEEVCILDAIDVIEELGCSYPAYQKAIPELIEHGYVKRHGEHQYIFNCRPAAVYEEDDV